MLLVCVCIAVYYTLAKSLFPEARSLGGRLGWRTRLFRPADSLDLLFLPMMRTDIIYTRPCHSRARSKQKPSFPSPFSYKAKLPRNAATSPFLQKSIVVIRSILLLFTLSLEMSIKFRLTLTRCLWEQLYNSFTGEPV